MKADTTVLIAGIGGASLGTEILKCLCHAGGYRILGCDISGYAFGHYQDGFAETFVVDRLRYVESVLEIARREGIDFVVPGAEQPTALLSAARREFAGAGVCLVANNRETIDICSRKDATFRTLRQNGFRVPRTVSTHDLDGLESVGFPCVIKPASDSGGSSFVFVAENRGEAAMYIGYLSENNKKAIVQEYLPVRDGEFTIGVLSLPDGQVARSIALRRLFPCKLTCPP